MCCILVYNLLSLEIEHEHKVYNSLSLEIEQSNNRNERKIVETKNQ